MKDLDKYQVYKLDKTSVHIEGREFNFMYTIADSVVKDEYKGQYEYVGGLQCNHPQESEEYLLLESKCKEIARIILK
jgi:hypothetical protein